MVSLPYSPVWVGDADTLGPDWTLATNELLSALNPGDNIVGSVQFGLRGGAAQKLDGVSDYTTGSDITNFAYIDAGTPNIDVTWTVEGSAPWYSLGVAWRIGPPSQAIGQPSFDNSQLSGFYAYFIPGVLADGQYVGGVYRILPGGQPVGMNPVEAQVGDVFRVVSRDNELMICYNGSVFAVSPLETLYNDSNHTKVAIFADGTGPTTARLANLTIAAAPPRPTVIDYYGVIERGGVEIQIPRDSQTIYVGETVRFYGIPGPHAVAFEWYEGYRPGDTAGTGFLATPWDPVAGTWDYSHPPYALPVAEPFIWHLTPEVMPYIVNYPGKIFTCISVDEFGASAQSYDNGVGRGTDVYHGFQVAWQPPVDIPFKIEHNFPPYDEAQLFALNEVVRFVLTISLEQAANVSMIVTDPLGNQAFSRSVYYYQVTEAPQQFVFTSSFNKVGEHTITFNIDNNHYDGHQYFTHQMTRTFTVLPPVQSITAGGSASAIFYNPALR